jgi:hypothetical protein
VLDVIYVMLAFESINRVKLIVEMERIDKGPAGDLQIKLTATPCDTEAQVPRPSVCTNVTCSAMNLRTIESALTAALYRLDFLIAEQEFERAKNPSAQHPA